MAVDWACLSWSSVGWDGGEGEGDGEEEAIEQHESLMEWDVDESEVVDGQNTSSANPFCFAN